MIMYINPIKFIILNYLDVIDVEVFLHHLDKTTFVNIYTIGRFQRHCNDFILTPVSFVSYLLYN